MHASLTLDQLAEFNPCYPSGISGSFRPSRWMTATGTVCTGPESWHHLLSVLQSETEQYQTTAAPLARQRATKTNGGMIQAALRWARADVTPVAMLIGLDAAGKTSMMHNLRAAPEGWKAVPMVGFNMQENLLGNLKLFEYDLGGQMKIRPLLRHYYTASDAIVFVVDATDTDRMPEAAREFHAVMNELEILKAPRMPVLLFAAKSDLPTALSAADLWHTMRLSAFDHGCLPPQFGRFDIHLQPCSNWNGQGLAEGFQWLQAQVPEFKPPKSMRPGQVGMIDSQAICNFDLTTVCNCVR